MTLNAGAGCVRGRTAYVQLSYINTSVSLSSFFFSTISTLNSHDTETSSHLPSSTPKKFATHTLTSTHIFTHLYPYTLVYSELSHPHIITHAHTHIFCFIPPEQFNYVVRQPILLHAHSFTFVLQKKFNYVVSHLILIHSHSAIANQR